MHSPGTVQLPCSRLQPCLQIAGKKHKERKGLIISIMFAHLYIKTFPPASHLQLTDHFIGNKTHLLSIQMANQPMTRQKLNAFRHVDVVKRNSLELTESSREKMAVCFSQCGRQCLMAGTSCHHHHCAHEQRTGPKRLEKQSSGCGNALLVLRSEVKEHARFPT